jgi:hypothetical protein
MVMMVTMTMTGDGGNDGGDEDSVLLMAIFSVHFQFYS